MELLLQELPAKFVRKHGATTVIQSEWEYLIFGTPLVQIEIIPRRHELFHVEGRSPSCEGIHDASPVTLEAIWAGGDSEMKLWGSASADLMIYINYYNGIVSCCRNCLPNLCANMATSFTGVQVCKLDRQAKCGMLDWTCKSPKSKHGWASESGGELSQETINLKQATSSSSPWSLPRNLWFTFTHMPAPFSSATSRRLLLRVKLVTLLVMIMSPNFQCALFAQVMSSPTRTSIPFELTLRHSSLTLPRPANLCPKCTKTSKSLESTVDQNANPDLQFRDAKQKQLAQVYTLNLRVSQSLRRL